MGEDRARRARVRWAPRVSRALVRRLYEADAAGIRDSALVDEVGCALYARCQSILAASAAQDGRIICPACGDPVLRKGREALLSCLTCGWQMEWTAFRNTYKRQRLMVGGAGPAFEGFIRQYDAASTYRDKILAIDRLVYALHRGLRGDAHAPAARNVIDGNLREVMDLLDGLAYGAPSGPRAEYERAVHVEGRRDHLRRAPSAAGRAQEGQI